MTSLKMEDDMKNKANIKHAENQIIMQYVNQDLLQIVQIGPSFKS